MKIILILLNLTLLLSGVFTVKDVDNKSQGFLSNNVKTVDMPKFSEKTDSDSEKLTKKDKVEVQTQAPEQKLAAKVEPVLQVEKSKPLPDAVVVQQPKANSETDIKSLESKAVQKPQVGDLKTLAVQSEMKAVATEATQKLSDVKSPVTAHVPDKIMRDFDGPVVYGTLSSYAKNDIKGFGEKKDSFMVGKNQYLEQGRVFSDTPEIMSKIIDNGWTGVTTAKTKGTDQKMELWNRKNNMGVSNSFTGVVYSNPNDPVNPYDNPTQDFTTPIANYPTEVVLANRVANMLQKGVVTQDPTLSDLNLFNPVNNVFQEKTFDEQQSQFVTGGNSRRLKEIDSLKKEISSDLDSVDR